MSYIRGYFHLLAKNLKKLIDLVLRLLLFGISRVVNNISLVYYGHIFIYFFLL